MQRENDERELNYEQGDTTFDSLLPVRRVEFETLDARGTQVSADDEKEGGRRGR